ncbi:MAG: cobyric acid synthase CobQ, partial [Anaerovoracaceae bacterium]
LPRISNFSDFSILEAAPGVELVYTDRPADLADADLIILPGTKSTISDLQWLKRRGLGNALISAARRGTPVVGICGGYQMLGERILDPEGQEAEVPAEGAEGLGLLPVITEFEPAKETVQTDAEVCGGEGDLFASLEGIALQGYEIHMGFSRITDSGARPFAAVRGPQRYDGCVRGNVMGTYLHGLFDSKAFTEGLLAAVSGRSIPVPDLKAYREEQYEKLAAVIRESLDMEAIYEIMGLSR